jgi:hypothetical protein
VPSRAGSPNKLKQSLLARLDARFPGWHPVVQMAEMANDETLSTQDRFQAAKEVAKYVTPQLKAIEHLDGDGNALAPMFAMVLRGKST